MSSAEAPAHMMDSAWPTPYQSEFSCMLFGILSASRSLSFCSLSLVTCAMLKHRTYTCVARTLRHAHAHTRTHTYTLSLEGCCFPHLSHCVFMCCRIVLGCASNMLVCLPSLQTHCQAYWSILPLRHTLPRAYHTRRGSTKVISRGVTM